MDKETDRAWVVLKFGGTSVADAANWPNICAALKERLSRGLRPIMVHSALAGVSDLLDRLADSVDPDDSQSGIDDIVRQHETLAAQLGIGPLAGLENRVAELRRLVAGIGL